MKRKFKLSLILIMVLLLSFSAVACDNASQNSPEDLIKEQYGNEEYKIAFSSESLDKPLEDLTYSAKNIPTLPVPQKVGYIFEGWFFDEDFLKPYQDDLLLLMMKDVTLYPKWSKETFRHNGTYDIEFKAEIVPGSVKKGVKTDELGGFRDITKLFNISECYIEKNSEELLLKLQYDSIVTTPYQSSGNVFTIIPSKGMDSSIYIKDKIDSLAEAVKTIFIKINNWNLNDPLYFDITWTNYEDPTLTEGTRQLTKTSYQIKLELVNIIGFSRAFADPKVPLEKGYYLAKSYFRKEDNGETMGKQFNPVYSYLYSDGNENYQLIKQNTPYTGLVNNSSGIYKNPLDYYYDPNMAFTTIMTAMDIKSRGAEGIIRSDFYPETYQAGKYHEVATEYHSKTGKFYNIINLDSDLSKEYLCLTAVSGYMERGEGMGYVRQILSIDYQNLIKLADVDYKPLTGTSYDYQDKFAFYPGNYNDKNILNRTQEVMEEYGIAIEMPTFFYSAKKENSPLAERVMHDSRVTVTPNVTIKDLELKDSRGKMGYFDVHGEVFNYDPMGEERLFVDRLSPQTFEDSPYKDPQRGAYNNQLHDVREIRNGKSLVKNSEVNLMDLFSEKVTTSIPFDKVSYQVYEMKNGKVLTDKEIKVTDNKFMIKTDSAVSFSYDFNNKKSKTIVELRVDSMPEITFINDDFTWNLKEGTYNHFITPDKEEIIAGRDVKYPIFTYNWGNHQHVNLVDSFYDGFNNSINPSKAAIFGEREDSKQLYLVTSHTEMMKLYEKNQTLMYELNNEYHEKFFVYFEYTAKPKLTYLVKDDHGKVLFDDDVEFGKDEETGKEFRKSVFNDLTYKILENDTFTDDLFRTFTHDEEGVTKNYELYRYDIYSNTGDVLDNRIESKSKMSEKINEFLADKAYGMVTLYYYCDSNYLTVNYPYKLSYGGEASFATLNHDAYFTNTDYPISKVKLTGSNRQALAQIKVSVDKMVNNRPSKNSYDADDAFSYDEGGQFNLKFFEPGDYRIRYSYQIPTIFIGRDDGVSRYKEISFDEYVKVYSNLGDITINYLTDSLHPFVDGSTKMSVKANLGTGIRLFANTKDVFKLPEERKNDTLVSWTNDLSGYGSNYYPGSFIKGKDFIHDYNALEITLKAEWEISFTIKVNYTDTKSGIIRPTLEYGRYTVKLPENNYNTDPFKIFVGYTGGFLGERVVPAGTEVYVPYAGDPLDPMYEITAKYKNKIKISFEIAESDTSKGRIIGARAQTIPEGSILEREPKVLINDQNYLLAGFKIKGTSDDEILDLETYIFDEETTLVAVFKHK